MIDKYGWTDLLAREFTPHASEGHIPGRIVVQHRDSYLVATDNGELRGKISGRLLHEAGEAGYPAVGDWVALALNKSVSTATIHAVLPRRTAFVRRGAIDSSHGLQVIAANIDVAFVVTSLNADLNARRIERYLAAAWQSGARPVVVLTKSDLSDDPTGEVAEMAALAPDCPVVAVSARQGMGLDAMLAQLGPGETGVLIGSSGVGKSTLVNALLGEERMATQSIRDSDDHGRHTTSHRQLILLPSGGMILDTPGIREVGLVNADEGVSVVFDDIEKLIQACRFNDCGHGHEPGCAVAAALQSGALDRARWDHFQKLAIEMAATEAKAVQVAKNDERRRFVALQKGYRAAKRDHRGSR
ncbi:MAG: ribosome small subunit-dependent GTPase A [Hyphomonadaceae bacterium]|nr:ribosome small subunit-dependent GTPase A [Hyphomonadaceae bacterium]